MGGGLHIIPVGNILNSSEPPTPQAINSDRSLRRRILVITPPITPEEGGGSGFTLIGLQ